MKLTRNTTTDGSCKYALIRLDKLRNDRGADSKLCKALPNIPDKVFIENYVEIGEPGTEEEFFVIKLKDLNAASALEYYASSIQDKDPELAQDVFELAERSRNMAYKQPD